MAYIDFICLMGYKRGTINSMKDKYLRARIDGDEYKLIAQRAKNKGLSLSQYVRFMIDKGERCTCKEDSRYTGNGEEW